MKRLLIVVAAVAALSLTAVAIGGAVTSAQGGDGPLGTFLSKVAAKLGVSEDELKTAIQDARQEISLEMIDKAVAEGRITEEQATHLRERVEAGAYLFPPRPHHPRPGARLIVGSAAQVLGMENADLVAEIKSGKSLAEVAEAQGMGVEQFTTELLEQTEAQLDELVAQGKLTAEQAERILQGLGENIDRIVNAHPKPGFHRCRPGPHRFRPHGAQGSPMPSTAPSDITL